MIELRDFKFFFGRRVIIGEMKVRENLIEFMVKEMNVGVLEVWFVVKWYWKWMVGGGLEDVSVLSGLDWWKCRVLV